MTLPLKYGFDSQNTSSITDQNGYTPDGMNRFLRVYCKEEIDFSESNQFFIPSLEFSLADFTFPIFIGIEYRKNGEGNWRSPEISHQQIFGHTETLPLQYYEKATKPSLIHQETEEGVHDYAAYPINIFSRAGSVSNFVSSDFTEFTIPNRLLPPSNLRVQLIQPESPLMLTSQVEQNQLLPSLPSNDKLLLRVSFEITHVHDINYEFAEEVEFVFREEKQRLIKGKASINSGSPLQVNCSEYIGIPDAQPSIPSAISDNFRDCLLYTSPSPRDRTRSRMPSSA